MKTLRFPLLALSLYLCLSCREGSSSLPLPETPPQSIITTYTQSIILKTPNKTTATIQFTTSKSWAVALNDKKAGVSWISIDNTSGEAGAIELTVKITEPNPSSLHQRKAYLKIVSDTAFRVVAITQPPRASTDIAVTSVGLNKSELKLVIGTNQTLTATVLPSNATNSNIRWSSSDHGVATINPNGVVSAVNNGKAVITATTVDADKIAQCLITVMTAPDSGGQINGWN